MALGVASPWRSRFEPSARTQEGAEAEDFDRRSAGGRPGQGEGAHRRAGASGWSPTTRPRFFSQGLATCRRASGASPGAWRDQLFALIKDLSAAEKSQGENETTSAPEKAIHEVQHLCQLAQLSRAGYYRHLAPRESKRDDADIRDAIHRIALSDRFYGYRRIAEQLKREGLVVNSKRVRRLMRLDNLLSLRYKPFVPRTTDSAHGYEIVCDLTREAMLTAPDHIWVADITYIRLAEEFVYLAVVMDAFSRKVVGWALADHLQASLPLEALDNAIASRGGSLKDLIHHSDRGVQYACRDYALRLSQIGAHASMSRPGTPQDNAKAESFMHTLKAEEVDGKAYRSREAAESKIGAFIDDVYNARRFSWRSTGNWSRCLESYSAFTVAELGEMLPASMMLGDDRVFLLQMSRKDGTPIWDVGY